MLLSLLLVASCQGGSPPAPPNFVVVLMDDVGRDKVGAYGDSPTPALTPNLDRLAARGVLFRNAWSAPMCSPTRASLLTGQATDRHGLGWIVRPGDGVISSLARDLVTLPRALPAHRSVALGKWHLSEGVDPSVHARQLGFDAFAGWSGQNDYTCWTENVNGVETQRTGYYPLELGAQGMRALEGLDAPFLVYHCPWLAHSPFHTPPTHLHTQAQPMHSPFGQHRQMVESLDTILGRLIDRVDLDTTYLFVLSDNGSPGATVQPPFDPFKVKGTLYEGGVRVPFLVAGPGVARGRECAALVNVTDLLATIVELAGQPPLPAGAEDSISFAPLLAAPDAPHARTFLYTSKFPLAGATLGPDPGFALRTVRYKLISEAGAPSPELYDLLLDPLEEHDLLAGSVAPDVAQVRDRLLGMVPVFP